MNSDGSGWSLSRRRLLRLGSAGAAVAVAGCLGGDGSGDGDGNGGDDGENQMSDDGENNGEQNNGGENNGSNGGEYVEFDTEIDTVVQLRGSVVATGTIDTEEIRGWALDGDRAGLTLAESGQFGGHTIYEVASDEASTAFGINENNIILGGDRERAEGVIETMRGERERGHEVYESYDWLLSAVGDGGFVYAGYLPESERSERSATGPRRSATGYAVSMTTDDGETRARFAASYPDLSTQLREQIRSQIGTDAESRDIAFDGNRAFVSATYGTNLVDAIGDASGANSVTLGNGGEPTTSEVALPESGSLPRVAEYVAVQSGLASGSTIDKEPFRTIEDGSLEALDSADLLLTEPVRRGVDLHNNLGQALLTPFPYLFRIVFNITEINT